MRLHRSLEATSPSRPSGPQRAYGALATQPAGRARPRSDHAAALTGRVASASRRWHAVAMAPPHRPAKRRRSRSYPWRSRFCGRWPRETPTAGPAGCDNGIHEPIGDCALDPRGWVSRLHVGDDSCAGHASRPDRPLSVAPCDRDRPERAGGRAEVTGERHGGVGRGAGRCGRRLGAGRGRLLAEHALLRLHCAPAEQSALPRHRIESSQSEYHHLLRRRSPAQLELLQHRPARRRAGRVRPRPAERSLRAEHARGRHQRHQHAAVADRVDPEPVGATLQL